MKGIEKEVKTLKIKRFATLICIIACIMVLGLAMLNSRANIKIAEKQSETAQAITITERTKNSDNYTDVTSEDNIAVPVPKGYVASPDAEERYVNGVTTDGVRVHHGGFVIYERLASDEGKTDEQVQQVIDDDLDEAKRTRNQWVWVPISSSEVSNMYHYFKINNNNLIFANKYNFTASSYSIDTTTENYSREPDVADSKDKDEYCLKQYLEGISRNELLQEVREEFYEMLGSVKTYGGFYIGRYETGNISSKVPVVKKANSTISGVEWYKIYKGSKYLKGANNSVKTGIIWNIQWDETLKWLIDSGEKTYAEVASDSRNWGNFTSNKSPTGDSELWKANNIYDLAGNVSELNMRNYSSHSKVYRGSSINYRYPVNYSYYLNTNLTGDRIREQSVTIYHIKICQ